MYEIKESDDSAFLARLCESLAIDMLIARVNKNSFIKRKTEYMLVLRRNFRNPNKFFCE